jgi:prevent-host-death family protein
VRIWCYDCRTIVEVASRELRNETSGLLRRVQAGESVVITLRGRPVADLVPHRDEVSGWLTPAEVLAIAEGSAADAGLRDDLKRLAGDTTEDLGPIR